MSEYGSASTDSLLQAFYDSVDSVTWFQVVIVAWLYLLQKFILKPFITLLRLKVQYGNQAYLNFIPILGDQHARKLSYQKYGDELFYKKKMIAENPQLKFLLGNEIDYIFIQIFDPDYHKQMFIDHQLYEKMYVVGHPDLIKHGLVFTHGEKWKEQRSMLGTSFMFSALMSRLDMMNEVARDVCENVPKDNMHQFTLSITGEVLVRSFFNLKNLKYNDVFLTNEVSDILTESVMLRNRNLIVMFKHKLIGEQSWKFPILSREKNLLRRVSRLREFVTKLIDDRIAEHEQGSLASRDFLDVQLSYYKETGAKDFKEDIIQQFITLVFAGTHTTSLSAEMCFYYLGRHPEVQEDLHREVSEVIGNRDVKSSDLQNLPIMQAIIQETLRLKNPVFQPARRFVKEDCQLKDLQLKKGWLVVQATDTMIVSPAKIEQPLEFNYKRWLDNQNPFENQNPFTFVPFSAGPRNCIGQHMALIELKIILAHVVRRYKIQLNPNVKITFPVRFTYTIQPENFVLFEERAQIP